MATLQTCLRWSVVALRASPSRFQYSTKSLARQCLVRPTVKVWPSMAVRPLHHAPVAITKPPMTRNYTMYRPVAFYALRPLSMERVVELRDMIEKRLTELGVKGRIYLAPESGIGGINCQMSVSLDQLSTVKQFFDSLQDFGTISYTEGLGDLSEHCFHNLRVLIKKNLVAVRVPLSARELEHRGQALDPAQWHSELSEKGGDALLIDMRNHYEYDVGHFTHAKKMDVDTFREGLDVLDDMLDVVGKEKDIYMYCTGGIRCDVASSHLRRRGYHRVKMLKGGITAYGHYVQSNNLPSLFLGKNFTFDDRRGERVTQDLLALCYHCGAPCDSFANCGNTLCHLLFVQCDACRKRMETACSDECRDVMTGKQSWSLEYDYKRQIRPVSMAKAS